MQVRQTVIDMLCAETGCQPEQLSDGGIHIVERDPARLNWPAHRRFNPHPGRIAAVTMGTGAVISVDPADIESVRESFQTVDRDELFRDRMLTNLISLGNEKNLVVHGPFPRFAAPLAEITNPGVADGYSVRVTDIESELSANPTIIDRLQFPNSLFPEPGMSGRPTVLAAVAERGDEIVGIAGVSKDSKFMHQIGIDVLAAHRGNGLAPAMTAAAARAVFKAGALPYYGTSNSNVASMRTALAAGLRPMWVEVLTRPA